MPSLTEEEKLHEISELRTCLSSVKRILTKRQDNEDLVAVATLFHAHLKTSPFYDQVYQEVFG